MAGKFLTVVKMPTTDGGLRDEMLERLANIAEDVWKSEPGTTKYGIFIPRVDDGKTAWVVEEYVDQEARDKHMSSEGVRDINAWSQTVPIWNAEDLPVQQDLQYLGSDFEFSRLIPKSLTDPHVIFAELDYVPGGVDKATPFWEAVVDTGREKEPETLAYGVLGDKEKQDRLCTFEVYESPEYLKDVHVPSDAISESIKNTKHLRTGLQHNLLKKVGGFLSRE